MSETVKDTISPNLLHIEHEQKMSDYRRWIEELIACYRDAAWNDGYAQGKRDAQIPDNSEK